MNQKLYDDYVTTTVEASAPWAMIIRAANNNVRERVNKLIRADPTRPAVWRDRIKHTRVEFLDLEPMGDAVVVRHGILYDSNKPEK